MDPPKDMDIHKCLHFDMIGDYCCSNSAINTVEFISPDFILAAGSDKKIQLIGIPQQRIVEQYAGGHTGVVTAVSCSEEHPQLFLSVGDDKRALLWNTDTTEVVRQLPRTSRATTCLMRPSASSQSFCCCVGDVDGCVRIFDVRSGGRHRFSHVQLLHDARDAVSSLIPMNEKLLVSSLDGCMYTYDIRKGVLHCDSYGTPITSAAISYEESILLAAFADGSLRLLEAETGECLHAFWGHQQRALRLSCDLLISSAKLCWYTCCCMRNARCDVYELEDESDGNGGTKGIGSQNRTNRRNPGKNSSSNDSGDGSGGPLCVCDVPSPCELFGDTLHAPSSAFDGLLEEYGCDSANTNKRNDSTRLRPFAISGSEDNRVYIWDIGATAEADVQVGVSASIPRTAKTETETPTHDIKVQEEKKSYMDQPGTSPVCVNRSGHVHNAAVLCVKNHPYSQRFCSAAADGTLKVWRYQ